MEALLWILGIYVAFTAYRSYANARVRTEVVRAVGRINHDINNLVESAMLTTSIANPFVEVITGVRNIEEITSNTASLLSEYMQNRPYRDYFNIIDNDQIIERIASRAISSALVNIARERELGMSFSIDVTRIAMEY